MTICYIFLLHLAESRGKTEGKEKCKKSVLESESPSGDLILHQMLLPTADADNDTNQLR